MTPLDRRNEILATTLEFKEMKRILYESATRRCSDRAGCELFAFLGDQEAEQIKCIEKNRAGAGAGAPFPTVPAWDWERAEAIKRIIYELEEPAAPAPQDLITLNNALSMEQACIQFFVYALEASKDPGEREFLIRMMSEGKEHMALLSDLGLHFSTRRGQPGKTGGTGPAA
ncbi:MAG: hypothetical protein WAW37_10650 [Syntrophobacteraceae bacterium]